MAHWHKDAEHGGYYESLDTNVASPQLITDDEGTFTGLYDAMGNPLHRERRKIGFIME